MKSIYRVMVELQHEFNKKVSVDYLDKNFNWNSAIIAESGELLDSLGYKWWKHQEPDMDNVKVEAIDLLHFVISESMQLYSQSYSIEKSIEETIEDFESYFAEKSLYDDFSQKSIDKLIDYLNYDQYDRFFIMKQIFKFLDMSNEEVYISYITKNCLNKFRQDNGYKKGTYDKYWNEKEDNVVAFETANNIGASDSLFEELYSSLEFIYETRQ